MASPAASSAALLIRRPDDSLWTLVASLSYIVPKFLAAVMAAILWFTIRAIIILRDCLSASMPRTNLQKQNKTNEKLVLSVQGDSFVHSVCISKPMGIAFIPFDLFIG
jgi:hypothetical protein